jgi:glycosyltransferase involved in cell wall biosynthesis
MAHLNFLLLAIGPFLPARTRILVRQNTTASSAAKTWLSRLLYSYLYPFADAILCQSEAMAQDLAASFTIPQQKLRVLANPIVTTAFTPDAPFDPVSRLTAANPDPLLTTPTINSTSPRPVPHFAEPTAGPRLLTVARLAPEKGIDLLLRAMPQIRRQHPQAHLEILGAGPEELSLRDLAVALHLESGVSFRGYVEDPSSYYPQTTLFVLPSRHEGMPNALIEAAAAGLPLVSTPSCDGLCDLLRGAPGTWVCSSVSEDSLAETVLTALHSLTASRAAPRRFEHAFLGPFECRTAIAAYEAILANPVVSPRISIAMLIPTIDEIGGAERQVILLAKELAQRDHQVTVIALSGRGGSSALELAVAGVEFLSLEMRKAWIDPRGWFYFLTWALRARPEILHAHLPHATLFARCVRFLFPVRVLIDTIHTSNPGNRVRQISYRVTSLLSNQVTCVSQSVANAATAATLVPRQKLAILRNGVSLLEPAFATSRISLQPPGFRWIAVGRLAPVKDYPTLLRAFATLPGCPHLEIVGSGPDEPSLRRLTHELRIEAQVNFAGFQRNVLPLLAASDAFVLSSLWEGLPVSALEAAASGLPVVLTDGNGTREAAIPGETGLLVPVGDVPALSRAMAEMMAMSQPEREIMGARGRAFVERHFGISEITNQWEDLYSRLLITHPHSSRWAPLPDTKGTPTENFRSDSAQNAAGLAGSLTQAAKNS